MSDEHEHYNHQYSLHERGEKICQQSIHDLEKARHRLSQVFKFFEVSLPTKSRALDVGCGLGYYTESLYQYGFLVTGVDTSKVAIESSQQRFTGPCFRCASYPVEINDSFDLIWAVDLPMINTLDINGMKDFVASSLQRLNKNGILIIGWHTDFSGEMKGNWAHWDLNYLRNIREMCGLHGPAIVQVRSNILNFISIHICRVVGKSAPIFFALKI